MERGDHNSGRIKVLTAAAAVVFVSAVIMSAVILRPSGSRVAEVLQDDMVLYTINLDTVENTSITVSYPGGSSNTIAIEDGQIWVESAECPDRICVKMGRLRSESLPIVCLPNHLTIRFAE